MSNRIDITGQKFGKLTVIEPLILINGRFYWRCRCDCGNIWDAIGPCLINGQTTSCGCSKRTRMSNMTTTHGLSKSTEYRIWAKMKERCYNEKNDNYHHYGGRGIRVCDRWLNSFENFLTDVGKRPSMKHSLDRYPDKNGNYEPTNFRWATKKEQNNNRRGNIVFAHNGLSLTMSQWSDKLNISVSLIRYRISIGKTMTEIIESMP